MAMTVDRKGHLMTKQQLCQRVEAGNLERAINNSAQCLNTLKLLGTPGTCHTEKLLETISYLEKLDGEETPRANQRCLAVDHASNMEARLREEARRTDQSVVTRL